MPGEVGMSVEALVGLGLSEAKAKETQRNAALSAALKEMTEQLVRETGSAAVGAEKGKLIYSVATRLKAQCLPHRPRLVSAIGSGEIKSEAQLSAAFDFLLDASAKGAFDDQAFRTAAGIGQEVTVDQVEDAVTAAVAKFRDEIVRDRYRFNVGKLMGAVKASCKWADGALVKKEIDIQLICLLGPKTVEELKGTAPAAPAAAGAKDKGKAKDAPKATKEKKPKKDQEEEEVGASSIEELMRTRTQFHKPGENYKTEGYQVTPKTQDLLKAHLKRTGGKVRTRFPPEPNGVLHIGHAKAINIDFGYAAAMGGECNLRFDDTNPEKEEERFFTAIEDIIRWLGYSPARITHSSDNFQQLFDWAVQLIHHDLAYVCHQRAEEMRGFDPPPSPWRTRPMAESLRLFEDMRNGKVDEGAATLRLKVTLEEGKQDPVAYRIKFLPHHRTGSAWCIYPTYDYTHCLCDSLEDITHSLCTKEFQSRRSSYYWLCNALEQYCPVQWEYGRLNVNYTVVSKRKIGRLITEGIVADWDDPRLFTLEALRRRGIPPEAINSFVAKTGITGAQTSMDPSNLDAHVRDQLNVSARRAMGVVEPVECVVEGWDGKAWPSTIDVPDFPAEPQRGTHKVPFDKTFYIDRSDFVEGSGAKGFKRLTETQAVGLKYLSAVLSVASVHKDGSGAVERLSVRLAPLDETNKPKGFVQWVAKPIKAQIRLYERLFRHSNPEDVSVVPGGFVSDCNPDSLRVVEGLVESSLAGAAVFERFQLERIGFFAVDPDTTKDKLVLNRTVLLKEDTGKTH